MSVTLSYHRGEQLLSSGHCIFTSSALQPCSSSSWEVIRTTDAEVSGLFGDPGCTRAPGSFCQSGRGSFTSVYMSFTMWPRLIVKYMRYCSLSPPAKMVFSRSAEPLCLICLHLTPPPCLYPARGLQSTRDSVFTAIFLDFTASHCNTEHMADIS